MNNSSVLNKILWIKALWNSFLALFLGVLFYMLPGLIIGFKMGFELGPKMKDSPELSAQISTTVSEMYQENVWLTVAFILVTGLLIFWRAIKVSKKTGDKRHINGLIVGSLPAFIGLTSIVLTGFNLLSVVAIVLFPGLGLFGSIVSKEST